MMPRHHPDASTLLGYSAGALPEAFAAVTAAHLAVCGHCREQLRAADEVGGQLLEQLDGSAPATGARDRIRSLIDAAPQALAPPPAEEPACDQDLLPPALRPYFGDRWSALKWKFIAPGVRTIEAGGLDGGKLILLKTAPGKKIPRHTHGANELTLILAGAYDDALGHFSAGDVADLDCDIEHEPVTSAGTPCICVAATDAPLLFSGWLVRKLQRFFGL